MPVSRWRRRAGLVALAALAPLPVLAACSSGPETAPAPPETTEQPSPDGPEPDGSERDGPVIAEGLEAPWSVAFHEGAVLVSERDSARVLELGDTAREVGTVAGVRFGGEGGLLGISAHDGFLYVYSTADSGNRIERYELRGKPGGLSLGEAETILDGIPLAAHHNGGRIAFGPDGLLYATAGDAGDPARAQDPKSLAGKILRVHPDGAVPDDNPFDGSYVYSLGHRNPQGIAWDDDGTMYASEFGQDTWDELNVIEAGGNYGWPAVEGTAGVDGYVDPVQQWTPAEASPSGIAVADGSIWIANLRGERLREVPLDDLASATEHWVGDEGRLRDAVRTPEGRLWVLTNNTDGRGSPGAGDDRLLLFDGVG